MWISDFAIRRPIVTIVSMLALVVFGAFALLSLDTDEFPEVNAPVVVIGVPYPGASPDIVEREVIDPIEEAVAGISGVDKINSDAMDGFASVIITFEFQKDAQQASQDVRDAVSQIRGDLPAEMKEPVFSRWSPNDQPIVSLTLASKTLSAPELTRIADPGLTRALRGLQGVAEVKVVGGVERELTVELNPAALQASGVGVAQVAQALQMQNLAAPVGRLEGVYDERTIRLRGRLQSPEEFERIAVAQRGGRVIRLGELARVRDGTEEARSAAVFNGEQAVGIDITKTTNSSTTAVSAGIIARVSELQKTLPEEVTLHVARDAGTRVKNSVRNVEEALLEGALLTVLVVFLFLNSWRSTVITGIALPVSVLASFVAVKAFGFTLNQMSLLGLSLAIGILIDDAIVVRENIVRHVEMGKDHYRAAREGTAEIGMAVAATTFSIVVVFVPIAFMGGIAQQWFAPFALTIACSVLVSLFVSFSLDPMLSAYWPDPHQSEREKSWITRRLDRFNAWFDRQAERYKRVIGWALDHRAAMVALALGSFLTAVALPALGVVGSEFFPGDDRSEFYMNVDTPPGSNLAYTRLKAEEIAALARAMPEVDYTYLTAGARGGAVDKGSLYVRLTPKAERSRSQEQVAAALRRKAKSLGGVEVALVTNVFNDQKQIQIQLRGPDIAVLNDLAAQVAAEVRQVPGAVDVGLSTKGQKPEIDVRIDRAMAGTLGISAGQIAQAVRPAFAGLDVGDWVDPSDETRNVTVRLPREARTRTTDVESLPLVIAGPTGLPVTMPLGQVARVERNMGPAQISHLDRDRVISVQANTEGASLSEVMAGIDARLASVRVPDGYKVTQGGETADQQEVFGRILLALGVAVMLMYLILVVQFGSFLDPLAIMISIPLSLVGVVLGLAITGNTLNIMSMIGVILLAGIVAKNAILLIDFAKWGKEQGLEMREAIIAAGAIRLRPILMTTFALIAGMIPVAMGRGEGAQFRAPMGIAVIGGVITSTVLTLLVIPTFYEILDQWREAFLHRFAQGRAAPHGAGMGEPAAVSGD
jgi:HAE1 family hydrophobic/amphiphilic exporter-1